MKLHRLRHNERKKHMVKELQIQHSIKNRNNRKKKKRNLSKIDRF